MNVGLPLLVLAATAAVSRADLRHAMESGDAAFSRGEWTAAVNFYSDAIEHDPGLALLYTKRAATYAALRQQTKAIRDLDTAIDLDEAYIQARVQRGKLHRQMCSFPAAEADVQRVLQLKPEQKAALKELSIISATQKQLAAVQAAEARGDTQAARSALATLYTDAPFCLQAQLIEARLWMADRDYEQAAAATGRLLKAVPGNLEALVLRGTAYFYLHDHELAKRHAGEALQYDPDHKPARDLFNKVKGFDRKRSQAEAALESRDWAEAERLFTAALQLDPLHSRAHGALWAGVAKARARQGNVDTALEAWDEVLQLEPGNLDAKEAKIRALLDAERWQDGVAAAKEAARAHGDHRRFQELLHEGERGLKLASRKDYYKILGVPRDASDPEIKRAYRTLAKQLHPDKVPESEKKESEDRFRAVAEAYEVLTDPEKRARFDAGEDLDNPGGHPGGHPGDGHPFFFQQGGTTFHFTWG